MKISQKKLQLPSHTFKKQYQMFKRTNNCDCTIFNTNIPYDISYIYKHPTFFCFPPITSHPHNYQYNKQAASPFHTLWLKFLCASLTFSVHTTCFIHPFSFDHPKISTFAGEAPDYSYLFLPFCYVHIVFKIPTLDSVPHYKHLFLQRQTKFYTHIKTRNTILLHILIFILLDMTVGDRECWVSP